MPHSLEICPDKSVHGQKATLIKDNIKVYVKPITFFLVLDRAEKD